MDDEAERAVPVEQRCAARCLRRAHRPGMSSASTRTFGEPASRASMPRSAAVLGALDVQLDDVDRRPDREDVVAAARRASARRRARACGRRCSSPTAAAARSRPCRPSAHGKQTTLPKPFRHTFASRQLVVASAPARTRARARARTDEARRLAREVAACAPPSIDGHAASLASTARSPGASVWPGSHDACVATSVGVIQSSRSSSRSRANVVSTSAAYPPGRGACPSCCAAAAASRA